VRRSVGLLLLQTTTGRHHPARPPLISCSAHLFAERVKGGEYLVALLAPRRPKLDHRRRCAPLVLVLRQKGRQLRVAADAGHAGSDLWQLRRLWGGLCCRGGGLGVGKGGWFEGVRKSSRRRWDRRRLPPPRTAQLPRLRARQPAHL